MKRIALASVLALATLLFTPNVKAQVSFSASSEATALNYQGAWTAATHQTQSLDFLDFGKNKTNHVMLVGHEVIAPEGGFNTYMGGVEVQPDLSKLMAKTNLPANSFALFIEGAAGNTQYSSKPGSNISLLAGGGLRYNLTGALTWSTLHVNYLRLGNVDAVELSSGLQYFFVKH